METAFEKKVEADLAKAAQVSRCDTIPFMTFRESLKYQSLADIPEAQLVETLLADTRKSALFNLEGIPSDVVPFPMVPFAELADEARGDVDILLVAPNRAYEATAVEVKRIKVGLNAVQNDAPNKMQEYKKAVQQANRLANIGFGQVYLWIIVVADTREQNSRRYTYDGLRAELRSTISQHISHRELLPSVGLAHYEFVQPMDYAPLKRGTNGVHLIRRAEIKRQPEDLTRRIGQFISGHPRTNDR